MSKLKEVMHTPVKLAASDYPGRTEKSYLETRIAEFAATLPAGAAKDFLLDPSNNTFERAHRAGVSLSRHR
jgi:hypothetical protein